METYYQYMDMVNTTDRLVLGFNLTRFHAVKEKPATWRTTNKKRIKMYKQMAVFVAPLVLTMCILYCLALIINMPSAYADKSITMTKQESFRDFNGNLNVIGVVDNNGNTPVEVMVSLNTIDKNTKSVTTISDPTYGGIIYPLTGAPFKFVIQPNQSPVGTAFISNIKQIQVPYYNVLRLNYSNMAVGSDKALVGTAKNVGPFDLYDVSVYASVHDKNRTQIDSVKSNVIPIIKPGEEVTFSAVPDSAISPNVTYFSCAGVSLNNSPMTTLAIDKGQSISYDIIGVVRISDFKYNTANDSIMFGVKHYNPDGGTTSLKIVKNSSNPSLSVLMDGKPYNPAPVKTMDGKTVHIDFFLSPGDHNVQVKG